MNAIDQRTNEIIEEIRINFQIELDDSIRSDLQFHAACFRCAVLEEKLRQAKEFEDKNNVAWRGKA